MYAQSYWSWPARQSCSQRACLRNDPNGRHAIVVEMPGAGPPDRPDAKLADLPPGRIITAIDLGDPARPVIVQRLVDRSNPLAPMSGRRLLRAIDRFPASRKRPSESFPLRTGNTGVSVPGPGHFALIDRTFEFMTCMSRRHHSVLNKHIMATGSAFGQTTRCLAHYCSM